MPELFGNRIFLEIPPKQENKIVIPEEAKEEYAQELLKKYSKLKVHSVGTTVSHVNVGDLVLIDPSVLSKSLKIDLSDEVEVLLISSFDVIMKW